MAKKKESGQHERLLALNKALEERLQAKLGGMSERLDAVTQSLELVAHMQLATDRQIEKIERQIERFVTFAQAIIERHDKRITKLERGQ